MEPLSHRFPRRRRSRGRSRFAAFVSDERGSITMEFLLWLPIFVVVLGVAIDASLVLQAHADMWSVARDGARRMAMLEITDEQAETYALEKLQSLYTYDFTASAYMESSGSDTFSVVEVNTFVSSANFSSIFTDQLSSELAVHVRMRNRKDPI